MAEGASHPDGLSGEPPLRDKPHVQQLEVLMGRLDALPELPASTAAILQAAAAEMPLAEALEQTPALAARIRSLAGDAPVESACLAVLCMKLSAAFAPAAGLLDREAFWEHSIAVAVAAEMIAARAGGETATAFACGLLHDVGKIALDACLPKSYAKVLASVRDGRGDIARSEREIIGTDHTVAGRRLARHWHTPDCVQEVVWLHHQPSEAVPPSLATAGLIAIVRLADTIVRRAKIGFSGNYVFDSDDAASAAAAGVSADDVAEVARLLPDRLEARKGLLKSAAAFDRDQPAPALATESVSEAAPAEAAGPGDVLKLLGDFALQTTPATPLPDLCGRIVHTFARITGITNAPIGAFAISTPSGRATLALRLPDGRQVCRVSPCRGPAPVPADRCRPAGDTLRRMLHSPDAWNDLLELDATSCLPLSVKGRWLGGVLIPAAAAIDEELLRPVLDLMSFVLAGAAARAEGELLSERLAQASGRLAETREALAEAQALAAVGEMAAGAAHELNNPLAVISGRAQLLAGKAKTDAERRAIKKIEEKAQEISDIATQLLAFARPEPPEPTAVDVADLLETVRKETESFAKRKKPHLTVDIGIDSDCPRVWADAGQMQAVFVELVRNAFEAGRAAGRDELGVRITAAKRTGKPGVLLQVTDDGPGMSEETVAAAFTPFFSHRPAGRSRGMGLSQARRRVQASSGSIRIASRPDEGTTVFVELPSPPGDGSR